MSATSFVLVLPAYNEEEGLRATLGELPEGINLGHVVVVDDGSTDKTSQVAAELGAKVIRHDKNKGKVAAIMTGIRSTDADIIVMSDADGTYPVARALELVSMIQNGADLAIGSRFNGRLENMSRLNRSGNRVLSLFSSFLSAHKVTDAQSGFRAFRRSMIDELEVRSTGLEFETEMTTKAAIRGYRVVEIPIQYRPRIGKSKLRPFRDGLRMFVRLLRLAWRETSVSAKAMMLPSIVLLLIGLYTAGVSIWDYITTGTVGHEFFPLLTAIAWIVASQFFAMGLILDHLTKKLERIEERVTLRSG